MRSPRCVVHKAIHKLSLDFPQPKSPGGDTRAKRQCWATTIYRRSACLTSLPRPARPGNSTSYGLLTLPWPGARHRRAARNLVGERDPWPARRREGAVSLTCAAMPLTVNRLTLRFVSDTYSLELQ